MTRRGEGFPVGGGEMGDLIRAFDWSKTAVGPISSWPHSLRTAVGILLASRHPMWIFWGPELVGFYNDGFRPILGAHMHPNALGAPGRETWGSIWDLIGPDIERVMSRGEDCWHEDTLVPFDRSGFLEEIYFTYAYSPIRDESGDVGGTLVVCTETTRRVIGERRLHTLRELATEAGEQRSVDDVCAEAMDVLASNRHDVPFALLYLPDEDRETARLFGAVGIEGVESVAPSLISLVDDDASPWPVAEAFRAGRTVRLDALPTGIGRLPGGPWPEHPRQAVIEPVPWPGQPAPAGVLVAAASPRLALDEAYRDFFTLVAGQIASAISNARAAEEERRRADALAELDRAKTAFFSNVSHELRTPLTLILGPVEELLEAPEPAAGKDQLEVVHRNGLRLLKLVNTMLDFSRIEAGRIQAGYEPVDLAAYTAELASAFRSAVERAGLRLVVDCPPLPEPVYVDRDMWEKIVLNLVSNAFKFTLGGEIEVRVDAAGGNARLTVRDTGVGIPAEELPRVFDRFHRVESSRGRTYEGTGIGLALVRELARLHGGDVELESEPGTGSRFVVTVPLGNAHLDPRFVTGSGRPEPTAIRARAFVEEAMRWLPDDEDAGVPDVPDVPLEPPAPAAAFRDEGDGRARIVWADDNADMRDYVARLLGESFDVEVVTDGAAALAAVRRDPPDLVLADIMMPGLDGIGLLNELRADAALAAIPVILVSARAGEDARVEGMQAGADDYLTKPFTARELVARVESHVRTAHLRREAGESLRVAAEADRYRARLTDALRPLADPVEIQAVAARVLGEHLQASRVLYGEIGADEKLVSVERGFSGGAATLTGTFRIEEYGRFYLDGLRAGATIVVTDVAHDERLSDAERGAHVELGVGAVVAVPLVKAGRLAALLAVHQSEPRSWRSDEVAIVEETAERTWDAVERARAEQALRESEQELRGLVAASSQIVWTTDAEGRIVEDSPTWRAFTGQSEDEAKGMGWLAALHPDDRERVEREWRRHVAAHAPFEIDYRLRHFGGEWRWTVARAVPISDDIGTVRKWIGMNVDVTDRRRVEDALRASEELFRSIANAAPTIIWTAAADGAITFQNRRWLEYTGLTPEENVLDWSRVLHSDDVEQCAEAWARALATGEDYEIEVRNRRFDGEYRWFLTRATPQRDAEGTIVQWLGISTDIHDRRQLEESLRLREAEERRGRERAELLAAVVGELESVEGVEARAQRLVDLLVPRFAAYASVELPGEPRPLARRGHAPPSARLPLRMGGSWRGTLALGYDTARPEAEDDDPFALEIAERTSLLLGNARLREEEHRITHRLQEALLPNRLLRHPAVAVSARYEAGSHGLDVGGDWYDSFVLPGGAIGVAVGDVVGHGLDAAAAMGRIRTALAALAVRAAGPGQLLARLDEFASGPNGVDFATCAYAMLDPESGELRYASAGHPPMLVLTPSGEARWLEDGRSLPLGYAITAERAEAAVILERGSLLVLYSDGLVERRGEPLSVGLSRLEATVKTYGELPIEILCDRIVGELGAGSPRSDDTVVMCLRFAPVRTRRFHHVFDARPEELRIVRAAARSWLEEGAISGRQRGDVLVALGEACANAVEHAYREHVPGRVDVEIVEDAEKRYTVRVSDHGSWRRPWESGDDRGHGTGLIEALADDFARETTDGGTTVTFRVPPGGSVRG